MYTSMIFALASYCAGSGTTAATNLVWLNDYFAAQKIGQTQNRPLAVLVSSGPGGFEKVIQPGRMNSEIANLLKGHFVCVYLDISKKDANNFANVLSITKGQGIILSDRSGKFQAFHCDGTIPEKDLLPQLQQFANPEVVVERTVSYTESRLSNYPPSSSANSSPQESFPAKSC